MNLLTKHSKSTSLWYSGADIEQFTTQEIAKCSK